jgi:hypothetical protein
MSPQLLFLNCFQYPDDQNIVLTTRVSFLLSYLIPLRSDDPFLPISHLPVRFLPFCILLICFIHFVLLPACDYYPAISAHSSIHYIFHPSHFYPPSHPESTLLIRIFSHFSDF